MKLLTTILLSILFTCLYTQDASALTKEWDSPTKNVIFNGQPCVMSRHNTMNYHITNGKFIIESLTSVTTYDCTGKTIISGNNGTNIETDTEGYVLSFSWTSCSCIDCGEWDGCAELSSPTEINDYITELNEQINLLLS
jgi:hypothetical protein